MEEVFLCEEEAEAQEQQAKARVDAANACVEVSSHALEKIKELLAEHPDDEQLISKVQSVADALERAKEHAKDAEDAAKRANEAHARSREHDQATVLLVEIDAVTKALTNAPLMANALQEELESATEMLRKLRVEQGLTAEEPAVDPEALEEKAEDIEETKEAPTSFGPPGWVDKPEGAPKYEFCIWVPKAAEAYFNELKIKVEKAGFITDPFDSFCLQGEKACRGMRLAVPRARLREFADAMNSPGRLDPTALRLAAAELDPPITFEHVARKGQSLADVTKERGLYPPFLFIFVPYETSRPELFEEFSPSSRHKITLAMLAANSNLPDVDGQPCPARGAGLDLRKMDQCVPFKEEDDAECKDATIMLLHDSINDEHSARAQLDKTWMKGSAMPWNCPTHMIREYFGDQVGFYYVFLGTYCEHCLPVGLIGALISIGYYIAPPGQSTRRQLPVVIFAPLIVFSMAFFIAHFRRRQNHCAKEWGCFAWAAGKPTVRPDFTGTPQTDAIDGHIAIDFPVATRTKRVLLSWAVISGLLCVVVFAISAIFTFKFWTAGNAVAFLGWDKPEQAFWATFGGPIASALNVCQVQILNQIYGGMAVALTKHENWKTDDAYSNNLIAKLFLFKFFNTFASVFYVAFGKAALEPSKCGSAGCIDTLSGQIMLLFVTGAGASLAAQLILPAVQKKALEKKTGDNYGDKSLPSANCEEQFLEMSEYDSIEGPIGDFMEVAIQFGFLACFGASFPVAPLMCFFLNIVQMKQDGYKLLHLSRRPLSLQVTGIGIWETIFIGILHVAVLTNAGLALFTSRLLTGWTLHARVWAFLIVITLGLSCVQIILRSYPAESEAVTTQKRRQLMYNSRVVLSGEVDDIFDEGEKNIDKKHKIRKLLIEADHPIHIGEGKEVLDA